MTPEQWFTRREDLALAFDVPVTEVPAEAVWYLSWPPSPLTREEIERAIKLWEELQG